MHIKIENLSHRFDERAVLQEINFDDECASLAVIGPSGGGKSTLLRILGGLINPSQGSFSFNGHPMDYRSDRTLQKKIGFVFQNNGLFPHLCGLANVTLPLIHVYHMNPDDAEELAGNLLSRFGLLQDAEKFPYELSGGQQQRIAIARAVAPRPEVLLLDEPTSALDPEFTSEVLDMVHELQMEGLHTIIVTHEMSFAQRACEKALFLAEGRIIEYEKSPILFGSPQSPLLQSFLCKVLEWNEFDKSGEIG